MKMKLSLRQVMVCTVCDQEIDPVPLGLRPKEPLTGRLHIGFCFALGVCPGCLTVLDFPWPYNRRKIIQRYFRRMNKLKKK